MLHAAAFDSATRLQILMCYVDLASMVMLFLLQAAHQQVAAVPTVLTATAVQPSAPLHQKFQAARVQIMKTQTLQQMELQQLDLAAAVMSHPAATAVQLWRQRETSRDQDLPQQIQVEVPRWEVHQATAVAAALAGATVPLVLWDPVWRQALPQLLE